MNQMMTVKEFSVLWCWICQLPTNKSVTNESATCPQADIKDTCFVDSVTTSIQVAYLLIFSALILALVCYAKFTNRYCYTKYFQRLPGHSCRYVLTALLLLVIITCLAEGLLEDKLWSDADKTIVTRPHLYLQFVFTPITLVLSIIYYHHIESLRLPTRFRLVLIIYWILSLGGEILRLLNLIAELDNISVDILRLDLNCVLLALYGTILIMECVCSFIHKLFGTSRRGHHITTDTEDHHTLPKMRYLQDHVNLASAWTFSWFGWLLSIGYKKPLEMDDLGVLPPKHSSLQMYKVFKKAFHRELEASQNRGCPPSLWRVIFKVYGTSILGSGILKLIADLAGFVGPFVIRFIVQYVSKNKDGVKYLQGVDHLGNQTSLQTSLDTSFYIVSFETFFANGFVLVGFMIIAGIVQFLTDQYHTYMCIVTSIHARTAVQTMIFEKSLRLSNFALSGGSMTAGHVTNHMSTDAMNLLFYIQKMHFIWAIPLQIIMALGLLYYQIGPSSLLGFIVFAAVMPLIFILAQIMSNIQKQAMKFTDDRLKHSNELLQGIKLLKLYGWENLFREAVERIRRVEIRQIIKYNSCYGTNVFVCQVAPTLVTLVAFASFPYLSNQPLTPGVTFTSLALMNMLIEPLYLLPLAISLLVNARVSAQRISAFFLAPEVEDSGDNIITFGDEDRDKEAQAHTTNLRLTDDGALDNETDQDTRPLLPGTSSVRVYNGIGTQSLLPGASSLQVPYNTQHSVNSHNLPPDVAIKIKGGFFSWDPAGSPVISDLDVEIPAGKVTVVVGSVGSGKSSLLSAVFMEMKTVRGTVELNHQYSSIAYASQKAWIANASLRDNILFGQTLDAKRYQQVINACSLQPDINILPGGDLIEIGEKGINLSGGQKQRVSVARAMYSSNSIVLLDDPLSALDVHVGGHLFQEGIIRFLQQKEKRTVVLVTHQLQYLQQADLILVLKDGRITHQGTFDEICNADASLSDLWTMQLREPEKRLTESENETGSDSDGGVETERWMLRQRMKREKARLQLEQISSDGNVDSDIGTLIEQEELQRGSVSGEVYAYYLGSMGIPLVVLVILTYVYLTGFNIYKNFWLANWSKAGVNATSIADADTVYYIEGYSILNGLSIFGSFITMTTFIAAFMRAASKLHIDMLRNIVGSPMRFFDTTPIGRILNRFSSDTNVIDMKLIETAENMAYHLMGTVSALIVNAIIAPIFIAEMIPILVFYYYVQKYFITTSRELQRLDSITKSPVFSHFSETLGGLSTIRAYKDQRRFFQTLLSRLDVNNTAYLYLQTGYCWLGTVLNSAEIVVVLMASLTAVIQGVNGNIDPSWVGLAIAYALMVSICLNKLLRFTADTEMQMNPVERVQYYTQLPNESYHGIEPPADWPSLGDVIIEDMSVRYAADLDSVLRDVNIHFHPGEKVGVCGRTGSGKSSLTLAMFRLIDIFKGRVIIDGYNILDLPLTTLRQRLSIIPQDLILFTGSIRSNLDPESQKNDSELWHALEIAQLKYIVSELPEKLDSVISEGGENYSVGQRQLFCLARAFLRNSKILLMDEATASIDTQTEKVLQEVVATAFSHRTVITIAHRVSTILSCDTILVLDNGAVIEYDTPDNLLQRDSAFAALVQANK